MNYIHIAGHLGADPETRFTQSGKKVTTLRVATKSRKGGQDITIWWRVTIWDDQFKNMVSHLKKGSAVMVSGEIQKPEVYNDRDGSPQVSMELTASHLQFSPFGKTTSGGAQPQEQNNSPGGFSEHAPQNPYAGAVSSSSGMGESPKGATFDDEVPF